MLMRSTQRLIQGKKKDMSMEDERSRFGDSGVLRRSFCMGQKCFKTKTRLELNERARDKQLEAMKNVMRRP